MSANGLPECSVDESLERGTGLAPEPRRVRQFAPPRHEEFIPEIEADEEPERGACRARGEEVGESRLFNGVGIHAFILGYGAQNGSRACGIVARFRVIMCSKWTCIFCRGVL